MSGVLEGREPTRVQRLIRDNPGIARLETMPLAIISAFESGESIDVPIALSVILVAAAAVLLLLLRLVARGGARI